MHRFETGLAPLARARPLRRHKRKYLAWAIVAAWHGHLSLATAPFFDSTVNPHLSPTSHQNICSPFNICCGGLQTAAAWSALAMSLALPRQVPAHGIHLLFTGRPGSAGLLKQLRVCHRALSGFPFPGVIPRVGPRVADDSGLSGKHCAAMLTAAHAARPIRPLIVTRSCSSPLFHTCLAHLSRKAATRAHSGAVKSLLCSSPPVGTRPTPSLGGMRSAA